MNSLAFLSMPHGMEWIIIGGVALLIFGRNLPQVGRSVGRSIVEFKKGLKGLEDDLSDADRQVNAEVAKQKDPAQLT